MKRFPIKDDVYHGEDCMREYRSFIKGQWHYAKREYEADGGGAGGPGGQIDEISVGNPYVLFKRLFPL